jgi:nucleotide-binding universal stress UspA family protein
VHLNDERRTEAVLEPAMALARRYNSHLIGMHVYASLPATPVNIPYASKVIGGVAGAERKATEQIAAIFERMTANQPFVPEWRAQKVPHVDLAAVVMDHGRAADLIVAGQTDRDWDLSPLLDFPERLALESGRPVLVVPVKGRFPEVGRNIAIAWKPGRESARAVFDALPLLAGADIVRIVEFREGERDEGSLAPDTTIAASLARHGIKPEVHSSVPGKSGVAQNILARVEADKADLLVLGAFGHSRFREMVFGGVTRYIARHITVPTLFSH